MELNQHEFSVREMGVVARAKKEIYDILTVHGGYFLPPIELANSDYISDILSDEKLVVMCKNVIPRRVPQIKGLTAHELIEFASTKIDLDKYLPSISKNMQHDRKWLVNLINSLIPDELNEFITKAMQNREETYTKKQGINMKVKPEFTQLFKNAGVTSRENGKFYSYIKSSKIRRNNKQQKIQDQEDIDIHKRVVQQNMKKIEELERKLITFEEMKLELDDYHDKLHQLFVKGIINEEGNIVANHEEKDEKEDSGETLMRF